MEDEITKALRLLREEFERIVRERTEMSLANDDLRRQVAELEEVCHDLSLTIKALKAENQRLRAEAHRPGQLTEGREIVR